MKKLVLFSVLAALVAGGAFAQTEPTQSEPAQPESTQPAFGIKLSAGGGGYFTSDFGGGVEASMNGQTGSWKIPYFGGGGFAFFDATYAELSVGFFGGGGTMKQEGGQSNESDMSYMGLDIGLLGKYPFAISEKLSVFPLLGITYRLMLSVKDEDGEQLKNSDGDDASGDFSALWFKLGGGLDFSLTDQLYLRGGLLYGLRLANKFENDMVDSIPSGDPKALLGHGLEVKISVGYRF
jgi:opacity protein-like surface antigen